LRRQEQVDLLTQENKLLNDELTEVYDLVNKNNSDEKKYYELGLKVCKMYVKAIEITTYGEPDKLIKFASSIIPEVKKLHIIGNKIGKTGKFNPCG
jgi:hypothetical protein